MIFYYIIFFALACLSILEILGLKKNQDQTIFYIFSGILFILSFIRWECGTDWDSYLDFYEHLPEAASKSDFELFYFYANHLGNFLFKSYTGVLFVCAVIIFSFQTKAINEQSVLPITSLFILFGSSLGNVFFARQTISTMILFYSIRFIQLNRFKPFVLCIIIATLFHYSSLVFIPAWFIYRMKISPRNLVLFFLLSLLLSAAVTAVLQSLGNIFGGIIQYKINHYLGNTGEDSLQGVSYSLFFMLLKGLLNKAVILLFAISLCDKISKEYNDFRGYVNLYWMGAIIYFIAAPISLVFVRFTFSYDISILIIIPYIIAYLSIKVKPLIFIALTVYLFLRMLMAINSYYELYVPYKTIFA